MDVTGAPEIVTVRHGAARYTERTTRWVGARTLLHYIHYQKQRKYGGCNRTPFFSPVAHATKKQRINACFITLSPPPPRHVPPLDSSLTKTTVGR